VLLLSIFFPVLTFDNLSHECSKIKQVIAEKKRIDAESTMFWQEELKKKLEYFAEKIKKVSPQEKDAISKNIDANIERLKQEKSQARQSFFKNGAVALGSFILVPASILISAFGFENNANALTVGLIGSGLAGTMSFISGMKIAKSTKKIIKKERKLKEFTQMRKMLCNK
jgi:cation transport ATPase